MAKGLALCLFALFGAGGVAGQGLLRGCCSAAGADARNTEKNSTLEAESFSRRVENLLGVIPVNKGEWGVLIVDAASGKMLYQKNADSYFVPASNMKLLTTALAFDKLGPDYRFRTTVETNGMLLPDGTLSGDLILVGRGDPNLSNRRFPFDTKEEFDGPPEKALVELADAVVARGVKKISGDIVGDDSYFPRERYPDGWGIDDMVWEYGAAISAIVVDDNTVTLTLTPGEKAGDSVQAVVEPVAPEFAVNNEVTTIGAKEKAELRLTREPGGDTVVVSGTLAAKSAPRKLVLAIQEPAQHAANMLARLLGERGVKFRGKIRAQHEPDAAESARTVLAEHLSIRLGDAVKLVNKISQNLHTEVLLRTAARQDGRWTESEDIEKVPQAFYAKVGILDGDVTQTDGSGLSRMDMVTPRALVTLLQYAEKQPWFAAYYASLPVAGMDGTLSDRLKREGLAGKIHAKTGSLSHVRSLSGFAETRGGRLLIFSFLNNNQGGKNHETLDAMDGLCLAMMEEFDGGEKEVKKEATK